MTALVADSLESIRPLRDSQSHLWRCQSAPAWRESDSLASKLEVFVQSFSDLLSLTKSENAEFTSIFEMTQSGRELEDLEKLSNEQLVGYAQNLGFQAEGLLDRIQVIDERLADLEEFKGQSFWSDEANAIQTELNRLRSVFAWDEQVFRAWVGQLCGEYERRHPDAMRLPIKPLKLGKTNAARLPPVL